MNFYSLLAFSSVVLGGLALLILTTVNRRFTCPNRLLSLCILSLAYFMLIFTLIESGLILKFPHLYRTGSPLIYLTAPAAFLYVRSVLEEKSGLRTIELLHFLPAALHFLEMIPFFLQSTEAKRNILQAVSADLDFILPFYEGVLPAYVHTFLKGGLGLIYFSAQLWLIRIYIRENKPLEGFQQTVVNWLRWFSLSLLVGYGMALVMVLLDTPSEVVLHMITIFLSLTLLGIIVYLFLKPQILYGLTDFTEAGNLLEEISSPKNRQPSLSPEQMDRYKSQIRRYLEAQQPYLDPDFRMRAMVDATGIPRHHLSALINHCYQTNFNHFINEYRIAFFMEHLDDPEWSNFTLEGMAREAGFHSRSTFLSAFKRQHGMTPTEYLEKKGS